MAETKDETRTLKYPAGGLKPKHIAGRWELTQDQHAELKKHLSFIKKVWWFLPDYFLVAGVLLAGLCLVYFPHWSVVSGIGIATITYCLWQLAYRSGVYYGYARGYDEGNASGVNKMLGLSEEDAAEVREWATRTESDERPGS
ncbi:MAG: hypothetical protein ABSB95_06485 [Dissulfurispiraceae bacterium]|jgi:hypothetical protein